MSDRLSDPAAPAGTPSASQEVVRTYLELRAREALRAAELPDDGVRVVRRAPCTVAEYRALYDAVGAAWRWRDRLAWSDAQLAEHLARPEVAVWVLEVADPGDGEWTAGGHAAAADDAAGDPTPAGAAWRPAGYYELAHHADGAVEIVYFGLVAAVHGRGLGRGLLTHAVRAAWAMGATRVWLHTCTLDGPAALPNYRGRGFEPVREERYTIQG